MAIYTPQQFRVFRNHYLCLHCPDEWSAEMLVVGADHCPCCGYEARPYDTDALLEDVANAIEAAATG